MELQKTAWQGTGSGEGLEQETGQQRMEMLSEEIFIALGLKLVRFIPTQCIPSNKIAL